MTSLSGHEKRKYDVLSLIFETGFVGFNQLWKYLQEDPKTSMAKITLQKIVNELIEESTVKKIKEDGKQNIKLCAFTEELDESATNYKEIEKKLDQFKKYFKTLEEISNDKKFSHVDFSRLVYRFVKSMWFLDWKCKSNFIPIKPEEKRILKRIEELKIKLFDLSYMHDEIMTTVITLVSNELSSDMSDYEVSFTDELEEYKDE
ncbi:MAG: hypothetical protein EPO37_07900 [Nitrosarchaeum sp.]|nr:MAG: hypothetical protein EPO37_07900 [Nitrosarchaeum sp.]